jgi:hypothetical protein
MAMYKPLQGTDRFPTMGGIARRGKDDFLPACPPKELADAPLVNTTAGR